MLNPKICIPVLIAMLLGTAVINTTAAQCGARVNWDNLEYLNSSGSYSGYVTTAMQTTQRFAIGTNGVSIAYTGSITNNGESVQHSADAGADLFYSAVGSSGQTATITLVFDVAVTNLTFSIYDIDRRQRVSVNGKNTGGADVSSTVVRRSGSGSLVTLSPVSGVATTVIATSSNTTADDNQHTGTIDVTIAASVKTVTLSISNTGSVSSSELYLSDIVACVAATFPATYYIISRPYTGMSGYVLTLRDNTVYFTNPVTGVSRVLFTDPGHTNLNSLAYDPYNRFVYYTYSLTGNPQNDKAIKKYDVNTGVISTVLSDVTFLGIPVFENGVESGAGSFYNGSYFIGIEGYDDDFESGRKSMIWRIDFNASNVPYRASQVFATPADDGDGEILHDWSDFGSSNGILYDFDGASGDDDFYVFNMLTGASTNYSPSSVVPRQVSIGWDEKIYNVESTIAQYNLTNGVGTAATITSTPAIPSGGSWGDAAEAFRPFLDFGDAPATYDPSGGDPAVHDSSRTTLRIGANVNVEWLKRGTTSSEDNFEDGISSVAFLLPGTSNYLVQVAVYNNTGSNATLCAWLDYNGNGVFNTGEGISQVVTSSASTQLKYLYWPGITTPLVNGNSTFLRVRMTSTSNGMTTANPTGFYPNGEVEDYRVRVDNYPLAANLLSFDANTVSNSQVKLNWRANEEPSFDAYEVQRSKNGTDWEYVGTKEASHSSITKIYEWNDYNPYKGTSYYRLKIIHSTGLTQLSAIRSVETDEPDFLINLSPNPAAYQAMLTVYNQHTTTTLYTKVLSMEGKQLYQQQSILRPGDNSVVIPLSAAWPQGMYLVQLRREDAIISKKLLIRR